MRVDRTASQGRARRRRARSRARGVSLALSPLVFVIACPREEAADEGFVVLSQPASSAPASAPPTLWETPLDDPELERGRVVWTGTCIDCHSIGLGGAPLIGDASLWRPRIDKGLDVLFEHALQGFYGDVGEMPPRGGNPTLSDEEVRAAVRFMTSRIGRAG